MLTWQLVRVLAAEVDLLWGCGEERENACAKQVLMLCIQRSRILRMITLIDGFSIRIGRS